MCYILICTSTAVCRSFVLPTQQTTDYLDCYCLFCEIWVVFALVSALHLMHGVLRVLVSLCPVLFVFSVVRSYYSEWLLIRFFSNSSILLGCAPQEDPGMVGGAARPSSCCIVIVFNCFCSVPGTGGRVDATPRDV